MKTMADVMQGAAEHPKSRKVPPSRRGKKAWVVYVDPQTLRRLKAAAAIHDRTLQSLGEEAVDLLIDRYPLHTSAG